ncbi:MAG TPA: PKD domain-containing protein [Candidatus Thermoplasmatota archaeon]
MIVLTATSFLGAPAAGSAADPKAANTALAENVVAYEGFEGPFPAAGWDALDANGSEGDDFWGNSTARAVAGAQSAWAAGTGFRPETVLLLTEDFENASLPAGWTATDDDNAYGQDYWGPTQYRVHSGNYSIWSAQVGDNQAYDECQKKGCEEEMSALALPYNADIHQYDNFMNATVSRAVNLTGFEYATVEFWYWVSAESSVDSFFVIYWAQSQWHFLNPVDASGGWQQGSVTIPKAATKFGFSFYSDGQNTMEGAYVDDVRLTATRHISNSVLGVYENGMDATLTRAVSLAGYASGRLEARYWLESEAGHDFLEVLYFDGTWQVAQALDGSSSGWQSVSVALPATTTQIQFRFTSDASVQREGAYIDEVRVVGVASPLECVASVSATEGVEGTTQFVFRVNVTGGLLPLTWSWNRGDGTASNQSVVFATYAEAGSYTATLTVRDALGQACTPPVPTVTVGHDLSSLSVSPSYAAVPEGSSQPFAAFDALGHELELEWSVAPGACGSVEAQASNGVFHASEGAGGTTCAIEASIDGHTATATVDVLHDLSAPSVTPPEATVVEGQTATFSLRDTYGHPATGQWSTTCGRLNTDTGPDVVFTALTTGGNTCTLTAEVGTAVVTARALVVHDVSELPLAPTEASVAEGGSVAFHIADAFGHAISVQWSVEPADCGAFNPTSGSSTAFAVSTGAGGRTCTVEASSGGGVSQATLHVAHDTSSSSIVPSTGVVTEGESLAFHVADAHGHAMSAAWAVSPATCGAMVPAEGPTSQLQASAGAGGSVCTVSATAGSLHLLATVAVGHGPAADVGIHVGGLAAGGSAQATATVRDAAGHTIDALGVVWTTTCAGATPAEGERTTVTAAASAGGSTCTLTAAVGAATASVEVEVGYAGPFTVTVTPATGTLRPGESQSLTVHVLDGAGREVPPEAVAWVAPCGTIEGSGTTVTYTAGEPAGAEDCAVSATVTVGGTTASGVATIALAAGSDGGLTIAAGLAAAAGAGAGAILLLRKRKQP